MAVVQCLEAVPQQQFTRQGTVDALRQLAKAKAIKIAAIMKLVRTALSNTPVSCS